MSSPEPVFVQFSRYDDPIREALLEAELGDMDTALDIASGRAPRLSEEPIYLVDQGAHLTRYDNPIRRAIDLARQGKFEEARAVVVSDLHTVELPPSGLDDTEEGEV
jgi:hypothetical protein